MSLDPVISEQAEIVTKEKRAWKTERGRVMKRRARVLLRILLVLVFVAVIASVLIYTLLWNPRVDFVVNQTAFPLTTEQKLEDFEYLYRMLEQNYPYFEVKKRQLGMDWLSKKQEFASMIAETRSDAAFYHVLEDILMLLQNGHTNIIKPGANYEDYRKIYGGHTPWSQIFNNSGVMEAYAYWETALEEHEKLMLPVAFKYIEGGYCAWSNPVDPEISPANYGIPRGSRLVEVDGISTDDYIKTLMDRYILDYDRLRGKAKVNALVIYTDRPVRLGVETPEGERRDITLEPARPVQAESSDEDVPEHLFSTLKDEEAGIAYLRLPSFSALYVEKDGPGIRAFLEEIRDYRGLVIDIRLNGGGSTAYWERNIVAPLIDKPLEMKCFALFRDSAYLKPFIKHKLFTDYLALKRIDSLNAGDHTPEYYFADGKGWITEITYRTEPDNPVGFRGKVYLLVDDYVFSASESFAAFAKATGWATLVGTDTGGDGIGYDPIPIVLPNSGLIVRFPGEMGLNPDGSVNEEVKTIPDVYVEQTWEDIQKRFRREDIGVTLRERLEYDTILRKAFELAGAFP